MDTSGTLARWRQQKWLPWLIGVALLLFSAYAAARVWRSIGLADFEAPPLAGALLDGGHYDLARAPADTRLVYFWASWCPVCQRQKGVMESVRQDHEVITVATRSGDAAEVRAHLAQAGLHWPVLNDPEGAIANTWRARGTPRLYVLDGDGRVRFSVYGYTSELGLRARLWFADQF